MVNRFGGSGEEGGKEGSFWKPVLYTTMRTAYRPVQALASNWSSVSHPLELYNLHKDA